jgi:2-polyprenyl-3-methyl-5-hydroxy-6-metoxy-1,4-benzoquinol methylase
MKMDKETSKAHWEKIYAEKLPQEVSWYQSEPTISLQIMKNISDQNSRIIDVGAGESVLVDHLVDLGYLNLSVLDISGKAIDHVKQRLQGKAKNIEWHEQDVTQYIPLHAYDIWHDRAVFHFLTNHESRSAYIEVLQNSTKKGSYVIIATFSKEGPQKCSGLDVVQYNDSTIQQVFGDEFQLLASQTETHITPSGNEQKFIYFLFRRR